MAPAARLEANSGVVRAPHSPEPPDRAPMGVSGDRWRAMPILLAGLVAWQPPGPRQVAH
jgi:hypothetical protein